MLKYVCVIGKFQERDQNVAKIGDSVLYFTRFSILGLWRKDLRNFYIEKKVLLQCLSLVIIHNLKLMERLSMETVGADRKKSKLIVEIPMTCSRYKFITCYRVISK